MLGERRIFIRHFSVRAKCVRILKPKVYSVDRDKGTPNTELDH
jgi:hypothetical protein